MQTTQDTEDGEVHRGPPYNLNWVTGQIVDSAIRVHSFLGPGLLESAYVTCLSVELRKRGLHVELEVPVPIVYEGVAIDCAYRIDLLVEGRVVVECKAIQTAALCGPLCPLCPRCPLW